MARFTEPYLYRLTVVNRTREELRLATSRLNQGIWFRGEEDGQGPVSIPANQTVDALAVRGATRNPKGYEFLCEWEGEEHPGETRSAIVLSVSVPLAAGKNRAGLDVSGRFKVEGWTGVSILGHQFEHTLTVSYAMPY